MTRTRTIDRIGDFATGAVNNYYGLECCTVHINRHRTKSTPALNRELYASRLRMAETETHSCEVFRIEAIPQGTQLTANPTEKIERVDV